MLFLIVIGGGQSTWLLSTVWTVLSGRGVDSAVDCPPELVDSPADSLADGFVVW